MVGFPLCGYLTDWSPDFPDMSRKLRLIDFFCGAGGFSEGFRQQGFEVVMGIDNWRPAVLTHNLNHGLQDETMDVLRFEGPLEAIDALPDTEVIVGSPPCVSFSFSNKAGKADKGLGIRLIEAYLRVVAYKKHRPGSILKAWLLENVPNSRNYVRSEYTFKDLNLGAWTKSIGKRPSDVALRVKENGGVLCAADYGSPQKRQRFVCGEMVADGSFPLPKRTHTEEAYVTLGDIKGKLPPIDTLKGVKGDWTDPNYPAFRLPITNITDQFYDPGLYRAEWQNAKAAKVDHPFMGRMSFPEDENRPSRTIMATRSGSTREALVYRNEFGGRGDGEFRLPTIREAASLMGFPIAYQFVGSEGTKWKEIGNAVCPHMSAALAMEIRRRIGLHPVPQTKLSFGPLIAAIGKAEDLNTFSRKAYGNPPRRKPGTKMRRHFYKDGNMTVTLTNYDPITQAAPGWYASVFVGAGKKYEIALLHGRRASAVAEAATSLPDFRAFRSELEKGLLKSLPDAQALERGLVSNGYADGPTPETLIASAKGIIDRYAKPGQRISGLDRSVVGKSELPKRQLLAMYALSSIVAHIDGNAAEPKRLQTTLAWKDGRQVSLPMHA